MPIPAENIHYLFGTSLQVIATFVGLLAAGFFFFHDRLESERDKDETLSEIYDEIKKQYYNRFKTLFAITAFSIIMGFWVLYTAAASIEWHNGMVEVSVLLLHMFNLVLAGWYFIFMVDPDIIQHTANKLAKRNANLFNQSIDKGLSQKEFMGKFSALEKILRMIASKTNPSGPGRTFIPFIELIMDLHEKGIINKGQLDELRKISKARNISLHSKNEKIKSTLGKSADKLNKEMNILNEKGEAGTEV
jgi:hypothetical protein